MKEFISQMQKYAEQGYSDDEILDIMNLSGPNTFKRVTWRQSEIDTEADFPAYETQQSFLRESRTHYGKPGSVRLDLYKEGKSIEVKNYNLSTSSGRNSLARNIQKQYFQRVQHLPSGTTQTILLDIRGQRLKVADLGALYYDIMKRTNGGIGMIQVKVR